MLCLLIDWQLTCGALEDSLKWDGRFLLLLAHHTPCHVFISQQFLQGAGMTAGLKWPASPRQKQGPARNFLRKPVLRRFQGVFHRPCQKISTEVSARYLLCRVFIWITPLSSDPLWFGPHLVCGARSGGRGCCVQTPGSDTGLLTFQ